MESEVNDIQRQIVEDEGMVIKPWDPEPLPGEVVWYTSKIDNGPGNEVVSPAMVIRTRQTTVREVIDRWGPEPTEVGPSPVDGKNHETAARPEGVVAELPNDLTVDLLVHGLGKDYREYGVSYDHGGNLGTWRRPDRVSSQ